MKPIPPDLREGIFGRLIGPARDVRCRPALRQPQCPRAFRILPPQLALPRTARALAPCLRAGQRHLVRLPGLAGQGHLTGDPDRRIILALVDEAVAAGVRPHRCAAVLGLNLRTPRAGGRRSPADIPTDVPAPSARCLRAGCLIPIFRDGALQFPARLVSGAAQFPANRCRLMPELVTKLQLCFHRYGRCLWFFKVRDWPLNLP